MTALAFWHDALAARSLVEAAEQHGLRSALEGQVTLASLAELTSVGIRELAVMLGALESVGLVDRDGQLWSRTELWVSIDGMRFSPCPLAQHAMPGVEAATEAARFYPSVVGDLARWHAGSARLVAERLGRPGLRILDAGAGAGTWSLPFAEADRTVEVVAVDLPAVLDATRAAVAAHGRLRQYRFVGTDLFTLDEASVGGGFDLVLAGNVMHLFSARRVGPLIARLADRLKPRGTMAVIDAIPTGDADSDRGARLYGVHLLSRTREGRAWTFSNYERWFTAAGLGDVDYVSVAVDSPMALMTATMPPCHSRLEPTKSASTTPMVPLGERGPLSVMPAIPLTSSLTETVSGLPAASTSSDRTMSCALPSVTVY